MFQITPPFGQVKILNKKLVKNNFFTKFIHFLLYFLQTFLFFTCFFIVNLHKSKESYHEHNHIFSTGITLFQPCFEEDEAEELNLQQSQSYLLVWNRNKSK